jgi:5-methylcytosine-specific restriction endonuclease McrA
MLEILWHDEESKGYTDLIPTSWLSEIGSLTNMTHLVLGPSSGQHKAKCDVQIESNYVDFDYRPYKAFNDAAGMYIGVLRVKFSDEARMLVSQVFWKQEGETKFVPCSTSTTLGGGLDLLINESYQLTSEERQERLDRAPKIPKRIYQETLRFDRNPDVIVEVLNRANGNCEMCGQRAPFNRADNKRPYLEVHHKKRLADGGEDTVENAIAVCPNCHRYAHYGEKPTQPA